jgi:hypothetical protein
MMSPLGCPPVGSAGTSVYRNLSPSIGEAVSESPPAIEDALDDVVMKAMKRRITPSLGMEGVRVKFEETSLGEEDEGRAALAAPCASCFHLTFQHSLTLWPRFLQYVHRFLGFV